MNARGSSVAPYKAVVLYRDRVRSTRRSSPFPKGFISTTLPRYIHEALRSSWLPCIGCGSHSVSLWFVARSTLAESCCSRSFAHCPSSTAVGNRFLQLPRQQIDDYPLTIPNATNVTRSSGLNYFLGNITSPSHRHTKAASSIVSHFLSLLPARPRLVHPLRHSE
jgi:hypothetical protein